MSFLALEMVHKKCLPRKKIDSSVMIQNALNQSDYKILWSSVYLEGFIWCLRIFQVVSVTNMLWTWLSVKRQCILSVVCMFFFITFFDMKRIILLYLYTFLCNTMSFKRMSGTISLKKKKKWVVKTLFCHFNFLIVNFLFSSATYC